MTTVVKFPGQLAFAQDLWVLKKQGDEADAKSKYGCCVLILKDSPTVKLIQDAILEAATAKWGAKAAQQLKAVQAVGKGGLHDGDLKSWQGFAGHYYLSPKNESRPTILNADKTPLTREDGVLYSGAICNFMVQFLGYEIPGKGAKGITCQLLGLQFVRDGNRYGGGKVATEADFDDVSVGATADDLV